MKTDARVKYTRMVLKKALLELLEHKPVNKITVKEVCERAGLNRATFYAHYTDCFDLLESIEEELFGQFERSMRLWWTGFTASFRKTRRSAGCCCSAGAARS